MGGVMSFVNYFFLRIINIGSIPSIITQKEAIEPKDPANTHPPPVVPLTGIGSVAEVSGTVLPPPGLVLPPGLVPAGGVIVGGV